MEETKNNFKDYLDVIFKHKLGVGLIVLCSIVTAIVAVLFIPRTYESQGIVFLGEIETPVFTQQEANKLILGDPVLGEIIRQEGPLFWEALGVKEARKETLIKAKIIHTTPVQDTPNILEVSLSGINPKLTTEMLQKIISTFMNLGQKQIDSHKKILTAKMDAITKEIESLFIDIAPIEALHMEKILRDDGAPKEVPSNFINGKQISLQEKLFMWTMNESTSGYKIEASSKLLEQKYRKLEALQKTKETIDHFLAFKVKPFKVITLPEIPLHPVKPDRRAIVTTVAIIALMLGVFYAFFAEYWQNTSSSVAQQQIPSKPIQQHRSIPKDRHHEMET